MDFLTFWINPFGLVNLVSAIVFYRIYKKTEDTPILVFTILNIMATFLMLTIHLYRFQLLG
jgi:hypothetical protein